MPVENASPAVQMLLKYYRGHPEIPYQNFVQDEVVKHTPIYHIQSSLLSASAPTTYTIYHHRKN